MRCFGGRALFRRVEPGGGETTRFPLSGMAGMQKREVNVLGRLRPAQNKREKGDGELLKWPSGWRLCKGNGRAFLLFSVFGGDCRR